MWIDRKRSCSSSSKINKAWLFTNLTYLPIYYFTNSYSPFLGPLLPLKLFIAPEYHQFPPVLHSLLEHQAARGLLRAEAGCVLTDHCPPGRVIVINLSFLLYPTAGVHYFFRNLIIFTTAAPPPICLKLDSRFKSYRERQKAPEARSHFLRKPGFKQAVTGL